MAAAVIASVLLGASLAPGDDPAGALDAKFGGDGMVEIGGIHHVLDVEIQRIHGSERYLVAAQAASSDSTAPHGDWVVLAYTPGGSLDPTFGDRGDGSVRLFESDPSSTVAYDLSLDERNRVVVGGTSTVRTDGDGESSGTRSSTGLTVVRLTPEGRLDTSFNGTGIATAWAGSPERFDELGVSAVAVPCSLGGGVIAVGLCPYVESPATGRTPAQVNRRTFLAKFREDGTLDDTFGTHGVAYDPRSSSPVRGSALQRDGRIVVAHHLGYGAGTSTATDDWVVSRFTSTGALDRTFGSGGRAIRSGARVRMVRVSAADDSVVAVGDGLVARYLPSGAPDATFDADGRASVNGWADGAGALALSSDGRVLVCGHALAGSMPNGLVGRFAPDGSPDASFGGSGTAPSLPGVWWIGVAEAADGVVVVGWASPGRSRAVVARYRK